MDQGEPATIEGMLSYPSDVGLPDDLKVCAVSLATTKETCTTKRVRLKRKGRPKGYRLKLPTGDYQVYATTRHTGGETRAYFTEAVPCGLHASCPSHAIITVKLAPGAAQGDVDPGDWYQDKWPDAVKPSLGPAPPGQQQTPVTQDGQAAPPAGLIPSPRSYALIGPANLKCEALSPLLASLRTSLTLDVANGPTVRAGDLKTIAWSVGPQQGRAPTYLMITADQPVRTVGEGFYTLTPNAIASFRIQQAREQSRIVIPLHIKDTGRKNQFQIRPLRAGTLHLEAFIVGVGSCGELTDDAPKLINLTVSAGAPEIVVSNRFELRKPDQSFLSPADKRRIDIVRPRWRLIDTANGSLLLEQVGEKPRFSPTGRFITAETKETTSLFDSEDGAKLTDLGDNDIAWDDMDSFVVVGGTKWGLLSATRTLQENSEDVYSASKDSHASTGIDEAIRLDLENNLYLGSGANVWDKGGGARRYVISYSLTSGAETDAALYQTVAPTVPKRWEFLDGLKFTKLLDYRSSTDPELDAALRRFLIAPLFSGEVTEHEAVAPDPMVVATRGIGRAEIGEPVRRSKFEERLRDFGLELNEGVALSPMKKDSLLRPTGKEDVSRFSEDSAIILDETYAGDGTGALPGEAEARKDGTTVVGGRQIEINRVPMSGFTVTLFKGVVDQGTMGMGEVLFLHDSRNPGKIVDVPDFLEKLGRAKASSQAHYSLGATW